MEVICCNKYVWLVHLKKTVVPANCNHFIPQNCLFSKARIKKTIWAQISSFEVLWMCHYLFLQNPGYRSIQVKKCLFSKGHIGIFILVIVFSYHVSIIEKQFRMYFAQPSFCIFEWCVTRITLCPPTADLDISIVPYARLCPCIRPDDNDSGYNSILGSFICFPLPHFPHWVWVLSLVVIKIRRLTHWRSLSRLLIWFLSRCFCIKKSFHGVV